MHRGLIGVTLAAAAACFVKPAAPAGDGGVSFDVPVSSCDHVPFPTTPIATFPEIKGFDPAVRPDLLELFFVIDATGSYDWDIMHTTRASTQSVFAIPTSLRFNSPSAHTDPAITADGTLLVYVSDELVSGKRAFETTFSQGDGWGTPRMVEGLEMITVESLDLSADGLALYFVDNAQHLRVARRASREDAFMPEPTVLATRVPHPTVSADGRELFFNDTMEIGYAVRSSATFETPMMIGIDAIDPDLTPSGAQLVVMTGAGLALHERSCTN